MACGCKKRFRDMETSESPVMRAAAEVIRPVHEMAMKVMDAVDELRGVKEAEEAGSIGLQ